MSNSIAPNSIIRRIEAARRGENPNVVTKLASGWLVMADVQPLPGYCVLLHDPVVFGINDLDRAARAQFALDAADAGDALIAATGAYRINYLTMCDKAPSLHTHVIARYADEPEEKRKEGYFQAYPRELARAFDAKLDGPLVEKLRAHLGVRV